MIRLLAVVLLLPLIVLLISWKELNFETWGHILDNLFVEYLVNSVTLGILTTLIALLLGVYSARFVAYYKFPFSIYIRYLLVFPLAIPTYIVALTYSDILGFSGLIQTNIRLLTGWSYGDYYFPKLDNVVEVSFLFALVLYPYVYLLCLVAFEQHTASAIAVARSMSFTIRKTFYSLVVPMSKPFIIAGASLVMMETLAEYGAVNFLGIGTLTNGIIRIWHGLGDINTAMQVSCVLILIILPVFLWGGGRGPRYTTQDRAKYNVKLELPWNKALIPFLFTGSIIFLGFFLPILKLLNWFIREFDDIEWSKVWELTLNTFTLASLSSFIIMLLCVMLAYGIRYGKKADKNIINFCGYGYAIPGTVLSIGVLVVVNVFDGAFSDLMNNLLDIQVGLLLSGTVFLLIVAYIIRFLKGGLNSVTSVFEKISVNIDKVSETMGVKGVKMLFKVHLPLIGGGLLTGFLIVFIEIIKELSATLFLRPYNFDTLAVYGYEQALEEVYTKAATPLLLIAFIGIFGVIIILKKSGGSS